MRQTDEHPFDVCACGDYRRQHVGNGRCKLNGLHGGAGDCMEFRFFRAPSEAELKKHDPGRPVPMHGSGPDNQ